MTPERWQQVRRVFDRAAAVRGDERALFLDEACGNDSELRGEVESLLLSDSQAGTGFLNTPAIDLTRRNAPVPSRVGRRIGVYDIVEEIGHGGMGEVYRAGRADGQYEKEVAIKVVRGGYDTASVLDRFRHERQILASLDHPNIARLLDGGTTDEGIPYLVMELIEGTPIDQYCDGHKLNVTERLRLFVQVCSAVQYAHQRLVIHRDIKPGNILVTKEGVPKLLDFGIAKILDPAAVAATTVASPMTPEYASPEQIRGESITIASDLYSLGVVLYQLLTRCSPYPRGTKAAHEFARVICEWEPEPPSAIVSKADASREQISSPVPEGPLSLREGSMAKLRRRLRGDLDTIVLQAMRKEPPRRYAFVEQFAEDIRRHLDGLPVTARPDSWSYRAGKFAIRHKLGVAATALILTAVLGGIAATVREARIAATNERRAEERFNDVRKLANSLMFEIHDAIRDLPGSTSARRLLVTRALEYLDNLSAQSKGDVSLQKELASAYERVGDVLGYPYAANLGDKQGALNSYRKALAIREPLAAADASDTQLQRDLYETYIRLAQVLESNGNFAEALETLNKVLPRVQKLFAGSTDPTLADQYAGTYYFTAMIQVKTGDSTVALENYERAAAIRDVALQAHPDNFPLRTHLAADYGGMAACSANQHDLPHAVQMQAKATAILEDVSHAHPENATVREYLGESTNRLATYRLSQGDAAAALETFRKAHQIFGDLLAADPKDSLAKSNFGFSDSGIGESLIALGRPVAALTIFRESVATFEEMSPRTISNRYPRTGLAQAYSGLGQTYSMLANGHGISLDQKRRYWQESLSACEKSLALWNDKEKRGELESGEHEEPAKVSECVATGGRQIQRLDSSQGKSR